MTRFQSKAILAASVAGILFAAAPVFAAEWTCTATNVRGATYTRAAVGPHSNIVHDRAASKAIAACRANSGAPASCHIVSCTRNS